MSKILELIMTYKKTAVTLLVMLIVSIGWTINPQLGAVIIEILKTTIEVVQGVTDTAASSAPVAVSSVGG